MSGQVEVSGLAADIFTITAIGTRWRSGYARSYLPRGMFGLPS